VQDKTGFVASAFDVMHPGYVMLLKECRDNCNYLVVGLHENPAWERDGKNSPIMSLSERFILLKSIRYISEIAPYKNESELLNLLNFYKPDIRFLGSDYNTPEMKKKITGHTLCKETYYINRFHDYSSSGIRTKIYESEKYKEDTKIYIEKEAIV
jgi:glycerol-3-phosphate cytidylyltransferase-like family protein